MPAWLAAILVLLVLACTATASPWRTDPRSLTVKERLGVSTHFAQGQPVEFLDYLQDLGITWLRDEAPWQAFEPEKGQYTVPDKYAELAQGARQRGLKQIWMLGYGNPIYENPLDPEAYAVWSSWMAKQFEGEAIWWELWNEPHNFQVLQQYGGNWDGSPPSPWVGKFLELVGGAAKAMKEVSPDSERATGDDVWFNLNRFLEEGLSSDITTLTMHPYTHSWTAPELSGLDGSYVVTVRKLAELAEQKLGHPVDLWVTEWGYGPAWEGGSFEDAAVFLARLYLANLATGTRVICWHTLMDWGDGPWGLLDNDHNKRPAYHALKTLANTLGKYKFRRQVVGTPLLNEGALGLLFSAEEPRRWALALWRMEGKSSFRLAELEGAVTRTDYLGESAELTPVAGGLAIEVGEAPVYLTGLGATPQVTAD